VRRACRCLPTRGLPWLITPCCADRSSSGR
jgi:hypothetical protein